MENGTHCPLRQALLRVQSAAKSPRELADTFYFLHKSISNFLDQPNDWRSTTHETEPSAHQLLHHEAARQFLLLVGLREENGTYKFTISDEGMKALEAGLSALNAMIHNLKIEFTEERPYFEFWKDGHYLKNSKVLTNSVHCNKVVETKTRQAKLEGLLARHLKQDVFEKDALVNWRKREIPDASFNSEGYFYQACQNRDGKRRKRCLHENMFDRHDFVHHNRKDFAFFPSLKLG